MTAPNKDTGLLPTARVSLGPPADQAHPNTYSMEDGGSYTAPKPGHHTAYFDNWNRERQSAIARGEGGEDDIWEVEEVVERVERGGGACGGVDGGGGEGGEGEGYEKGGGRCCEVERFSF